MSGAVLDAGALVAFERADRRAVGVVARALEHGGPAGDPGRVVAQVWRDGRRQARLARSLGAPVCEVVPLDDAAARSTGRLCGVSGTADVADASVALAARERGSLVVTSDPDQLNRIDSRLTLVPIQAAAPAHGRNRPGAANGYLIRLMMLNIGM